MISGTVSLVGEADCDTVDSGVAVSDSDMKNTCENHSPEVGFDVEVDAADGARSSKFLSPSGPTPTPVGGNSEDEGTGSSEGKR